MTSVDAGTCVRFVDWLYDSLVKDARGDLVEELPVDPANRLWLGRLAPEAVAVARGLGERGERLDPCAVGLRIRPASPAPFAFEAIVRTKVWRKAGKVWKKSGQVTRHVPVTVTGWGVSSHGADALAADLKEVAAGSGLGAEVRVEFQPDLEDKPELTVLLVNTTPAEAKGDDLNLYECSIEVRGLDTADFVLEGLPDSFRYDRRVPAYGVNCSVVRSGNRFITADAAPVDRGRPRFWNSPFPQPDFRFDALAADPLPSLSSLLAAHRAWGDLAWGKPRLEARARAESWNEEMSNEAEAGAADFEVEHSRLAAGLNDRSRS